MGERARAGILFTNFFLIILAYYQVKPASRSLFVEYLGADRLPYVWIGTALTLWIFIGFYNRIVERHARFNVVLGTCVAVALLLVAFRVLLNGDNVIVAVRQLVEDVGECVHIDAGPLAVMVVNLPGRIERQEQESVVGMQK